MRETDLGKLFVVEVPRLIPNVRVFRREIVNVQTAAGFWAKAGETGQADFYALLRGGGHVEIETKNVRGRLEEDQKRWRKFCEMWGVPYLILRAKKDEAPELTARRWALELKAVVAS